MTKINNYSEILMGDTRKYTFLDWIKNKQNTWAYTEVPLFVAKVQFLGCMPELTSKTIQGVKKAHMVQVGIIFQ